MRIVLTAAAAATVLLTACGGPETSQANNAQANIGNDAAPPPTAPSNGMVMLAASLPKDRALQIMHERQGDQPRARRRLARSRRRARLGRNDRWPVAESLGLVPGRHRPGRRKNRRQAGHLAECAGLLVQAPQ